MPEDRLTKAASTGEHDRNDTDRRSGMLDLVSKVPFGLQAAVLAGVLVAGAGVAGSVGASDIRATAISPMVIDTTCCPPVLK